MAALTGVYGADRGYERPWIANMKKIKYEQSLERGECFTLFAHLWTKTQFMRVILYI